METVYDTTKLNQMILQTKAQQRADWNSIVEEIEEIKDNLKPLNLIKNTVEEINEAVGFKSNLAQSVISIGIGYLAKRFVVGKSDSTLKSILGSLLQLVVTNVVSKKQESSQHESPKE
ncbi:hypothetical protein GON26_14265 [Flavobacterium sp. GA093]|uniref:Uncharacterized protein n=1 Tax=Flavobacterium hydrocarbonoxydans TaxID=2683249 RepID=A0A6I4NN78_9FLAO|nr:hypothetical protein [Flavobacterium hydrocarbonoxydans]MWB95531.1 hypothetical protein [Flavobacterium hydrocarbonoxydans]